jgi:hypothetical protein
MFIFYSHPSAAIVVVVIVVVLDPLLSQQKVQGAWA